MAHQTLVDAIANAGPEAVVDRIDAFLVDEALSQEQVRNVYNQWSSTYDSSLSRVPHGYNNPKQLAELFNRLQTKTSSAESRQKMRILDVACGTGLLGEQLRSLGFHNVDGVDGSARMLEVARGKGLYANLYEELIKDAPLAFAPPRSYDALLTTGSFCPNHLAPSCLKHLVALVKSGGMVGIAMRTAFLTTDPVLSSMEPELLKLQAEGLWEAVLSEERENYYGDQSGMYFLFRVL